MTQLLRFNAKLNITLLTLKKTNAIDTQRYYRLRCSVPQPPKLYGLPKLHKPGFPMRPIVSFCGSPTYQLSKYLTTILQPLTDKSRRNLQSTEDFINATKTVEIPDDYEQKLWCRTLSTCRQTIPLWLRYVDDTFTAVRHDEIDAFHYHLNEQNTDIHFTWEVGENGKLPFLDCLVSRDDNSLRTTVYRKPTRTNRLLDESSYSPTSHKATTITRRAQLVFNSSESLSDENKYLDRVFSKNNYTEDLIRRNTHRPTTTTTEANDNATPTTTETIPYLKGISENISRILQPFIGAVYKIYCSDWYASYIGETGRNLTTRLTEHKRATRKGDVNNHIAEHHRLTNHTIDWDSAQCLTYSTNYFQRLTLESWFTNLEQTQQVSTTNGTIQKTHLRH